MELDWEVTRAGPVTLVAVTVTNDGPADRRARLANRLDGPTLPPRREGTPEPGWDPDGVDVCVPANDRVAVGYACPAPPARPPVELTASEGEATPGDDATDPRAVVRDLGTARPPRDAVPAHPVRDAVADAVAGTDGDARATRSRDDVADRDGTDRDGDDDDDVDDDAADPPDSPAPDAGAALPPAVADWLAETESRLDRAERLDGAAVPAATDVLADAGGHAAVATLACDVKGDAEALRAVADRAAALADRAEAVAVPADAVGRLS